MRIMGKGIPIAHNSIERMKLSTKRLKR